MSRLLNLAFFLLTSFYCLLESSPFANDQFIKPGVVGGLAASVLLYKYGYWLTVSLTALTFAPFLERSPGRLIGWAYLAVAAAAGAWLSAHQALPDPQDPRGALLIAIAALVPPAWVALFDHATWSLPALEPIVADHRLLLTCAAAALFCWLTFAVAAPFRLAGSGLSIAPSGWWLGAALAAAGQALLFLLLFGALSGVAAAARVLRASAQFEYVAVAIISAASAGALIAWLVLAPIAITGLTAWIFSALIASVLVASWSALALQSWAVQRPGHATAVDVWCAPIAVRSGWTTLAALVALPLVANAAINRLSMFDWDFMLQKLTAAAVAVSAFALMHAAFRRPPGVRRPAATLLAPGLTLMLATTTVGAAALLPSVERRVTARSLIDVYLAADPALRLVRDLTEKRDRSSADFFAFLRANSGIKEALTPIDIGFVRTFSRPAVRPPHIFLFVIDSLRRDYVSAYNSAVTFTPALGALARENVAFSRAFSRYAGTGLSVPAIWAGSMIAHKEYVTPFAPMNALAKLLDAHGYRRFITADHITNELFPRAPDTIDLDVGVPEMSHAFCRTIDELEARLAGTADDPRPVFAHTRPLDLHIGNVWSAKTPTGESYPGFFAPYAARVRRVDACFGGFVEFLRRERFYDDSIIIVTADHGDSLGEGLRWGHGFTAFPEVLRIPLVVHLPDRLASFRTDPARVSFTLDITPTLYALLGDSPTTHEPQHGVPLFARSIDELADREAESFLVASSYGPVYGLLSGNGTRLYIADAINGREYGFDLSGGRVAGTPVGLTDDQRNASRREIRDQVEAIADGYGYRPTAGE